MSGLNTEVRVPTLERQGGSDACGPRESATRLVTGSTTTSKARGWAFQAGDVVGRLTLLRRLMRGGWPLWECQCVCGAPVFRKEKAILTSIRRGASACCKACGGDGIRRRHKLECAHGRDRFRLQFADNGNLYSASQTEMLMRNVREDLEAAFGFLLQETFDATAGMDVTAFETPVRRCA